jgi:hypothetical protein
MPIGQSTDQDTVLAVVCADAELLRAEFDAIIDATSQTPPKLPHRAAKGR